MMLIITLCFATVQLTLAEETITLKWDAPKMKAGMRVRVKGKVVTGTLMKTNGLSWIKLPQGKRVPVEEKDLVPLTDCQWARKEYPLAGCYTKHFEMKKGETTFEKTKPSKILEALHLLDSKKTFSIWKHNEKGDDFFIIHNRGIWTLYYQNEALQECEDDIKVGSKVYITSLGNDAGYDFWTPEGKPATIKKLHVDKCTAYVIPQRATGVCKRIKLERLQSVKPTGNWEILDTSNQTVNEFQRRGILKISKNAQTRVIKNDVPQIMGSAEAVPSTEAQPKKKRKNESARTKRPKHIFTGDILTRKERKEAAKRKEKARKLSLNSNSKSRRGSLLQRFCNMWKK